MIDTEGFHCHVCGDAFRTDAQMRQHKRDAHKIDPNPYRRSRILAKDRPKVRGAIPCGHPGCDSHFGNEKNAQQHRRDKHGIA